MEKIILASQSPRRKALLELAQIPFEVVVKSTDETFPPDMPIEEVPVHLARQKAIEVDKFLDKAYHKQHSKKNILAADTIVIVDNKIVTKPENRKDAIEMLCTLSGKKHKVITGVVFLHQQGEVSFSDVTEVEFHELARDQVEYYVDTFKPFDKAGAYAIQEWIGAVGIKCIHGDFYNVMGLPISRVVQELAKIDS
jgi:septum formation protein